MRNFVLSLTVALAFAGPSFAQTTSKATNGSSSTTVTKKPSTPAGAKAPNTVRSPQVQRAAASRSAVHRPTAQRATTPRPTAKRPVAQTQQRATRPETLRGSRYGGFAPVPSGPPPVLDTTSPRSLSLVNVNTQEALTVTYWSGGAYHREALDQLNHFLRDTRDNGQTEMDPLVFDVL